MSSDSADATSGVANATFQRSPAGAGTWTTIGAADTTSPYGVTWDTTALTQGNYDLRVVTTDNAGNSFTSPTRTVFVDSIAPTVAITFPADAQRLQRDHLGCGLRQHASAVPHPTPRRAPWRASTFTIKRNSDNRYWNGTAGTTTTQWSSTTAIPLTPTGTTSWNRALTTASLPNGVTYTVVATATDGVGLTGTDTSVFDYDTTNPTGSITAPALSANVRGNAVTVSSNSADTAPGTVASAIVPALADRCGTLDHDRYRHRQPVLGRVGHDGGHA